MLTLFPTLCLQKSPPGPEWSLPLPLSACLWPRSLCRGNRGDSAEKMSLKAPLKKKKKNSVCESLVSGKSHNTEIGTCKRQRSLEMALQWIGVKKCMHLRTRLSFLYVYSNVFFRFKELREVTNPWDPGPLCRAALLGGRACCSQSLPM